jgi:predicted Rossmann fold flavoprotein
MHAAGYRFRLVVDLAPDVGEPQLRAAMDAMRRERPAGLVSAHPVVDVPRRLWERLCEAAGATGRWSELSGRARQALLDQVKRATFDVTGKGLFREEFVTAGGVSRNEVDWRTMESKLVPGLFFAGESLDVDALTGGFNLQNAWSTGWLAGGGMASRSSKREP